MLSWFYPTSNASDVAFHSAVRSAACGSRRRHQRLKFFYTGFQNKDRLEVKQNETNALGTAIICVTDKGCRGFMFTASKLAIKDEMHWLKRAIGEVQGHTVRSPGSLHHSVLTLKLEIAGLAVRLSVSDPDLDSILRFSEVLAAAHTLRGGCGCEKRLKRYIYTTTCNKDLLCQNCCARFFFFHLPQAPDDYYHIQNVLKSRNEEKWED